MTGDDYSRLGEEAERLVAWIGNLAFMRLANDTIGGPHHCAALVLDDAAGTFFCSVYATRPQVCGDLMRGGPGCLGELATKGERPEQALVQLRATLRP